MKITFENIEYPETVLYIHYFCNLMSILVRYNNIIFYDSILRNWFVPCIQYRLKPTSPSSVSKLLNIVGNIELPEIINIWFKYDDYQHENGIYDITNYIVSSGNKFGLSCTDDRILSRMQRIYRKLQLENDIRVIRLNIIIYGSYTRDELSSDIDNLYVQYKNGKPRYDLFSKNIIDYLFCFRCSETIPKIVQKIIDKRQINLYSTPSIYLDIIPKLLLEGYTFNKQVPIKEIKVGIELCPICYDIENDTIYSCILQCNHEFHLQCLTKWWKISCRDGIIYCPYCKYAYDIN